MDSKTPSQNRVRLSAQTCTAFCSATGNNFTAPNGCHTGTKSMTPLANEIAGLKSTFHGFYLL